MNNIIKYHFAHQEVYLENISSRSNEFEKSTIMATILDFLGEDICTYISNFINLTSFDKVRVETAFDMRQ